jgi:hypothetical protein
VVSGKAFYASSLLGRRSPHPPQVTGKTGEGAYDQVRAFPCIEESYAQNDEPFPLRDTGNGVKRLARNGIQDANRSVRMSKPNIHCSRYSHDDGSRPLGGVVAPHPGCMVDVPDNWHS